MKCKPTFLILLSGIMVLLGFSPAAFAPGKVSRSGRPAPVGWRTRNDAVLVAPVRPGDRVRDG